MASKERKGIFLQKKSLGRADKSSVPGTPFSLLFFFGFDGTGFHDEFHFAVHALAASCEGLVSFVCVKNCIQAVYKDLDIVLISLVELLNTFLIELLHAVSELFCSIVQIVGSVFQLIYTVRENR